MPAPTRRPSWMPLVLVAASCGDTTRPLGGVGWTCDVVSREPLASLDVSEWPEGLEEIVVALETTEGTTWAVDVTCAIASGGPGELTFEALCGREDMELSTWEGNGCDGKDVTVECLDSVVLLAGAFEDLAVRGEALRTTIDLRGRWSLVSQEVADSEMVLYVSGDTAGPSEGSLTQIIVTGSADGGLDPEDHCDITGWAAL